MVGAVEKKLYDTFASEGQTFPAITETPKTKKKNESRPTKNASALRFIRPLALLVLDDPLQLLDQARLLRLIVD